jgi:hypothetical protein
MEADFCFARSLIVLHNTRCVKKTGQSTTDPHYYLSSAPPEQYRPPQWVGLIRGHWAGVEIRNHWRRDVIFGEDQSRSRNPNLLANMALIRNALLAVLAEHFPKEPSPDLLENIGAQIGQNITMLCS